MFTGQKTFYDRVFLDYDYCSCKTPQAHPYFALSMHLAGIKSDELAKTHIFLRMGGIGQVGNLYESLYSNTLHEKSVH